MKCPKCHYLGFETGDRCRNCGYDFSLLTSGDSRDVSADRVSQRSGTPQPHGAGGHGYAADLPLREPGQEREAAPLPLFAAGAVHDDEPLIKVSAPRPPLAVRRTPEMPRPRPAVPKPVRRAPIDPVLEFPDDPAGDAIMRPAQQDAPAAASPTPHPAREARGGVLVRRIVAAVLDLSILLAIDVTVIYFTLRMAALSMADWRMLPPVPMLAFLAIVKLAYFCAFTSLGGQTIGKMAARIQVVADDDSPVDPSRAVRRALTGAVSLLTFGLGFIPALIGPDRRALHDRVARTRVVARS
jgi:uncharacterized RDD family membrane protein YckC